MVAVAEGDLELARAAMFTRHPQMAAWPEGHHFTLWVLCISHWLSHWLRVWSRGRGGMPWYGIVFARHLQMAAWSEGQHFTLWVLCARANWLIRVWSRGRGGVPAWVAAGCGLLDALRQCTHCTHIAPTLGVLQWRCACSPYA